MGWQPEEEDFNDFEQAVMSWPDDEVAEACYCTGRGKPRPHWTSLRLPAQAYVAPSASGTSRGRGRAQTLQRESAPRPGSLSRPHDDSSQDDSSMLQSWECHSTPGRPTNTGSPPNSNKEKKKPVSFLEKWLAHSESDNDVRFTEPGEETSDIPLGLPSYHGSLKGPLHSHHAAHKRPSLDKCLNMIESMQMKPRTNPANVGNKAAKKRFKKSMAAQLVEKAALLQNSLNGVSLSTGGSDCGPLVSSSIDDRVSLSNGAGSMGSSLLKEKDNVDLDSISNLEEPRLGSDVDSITQRLGHQGLTENRQTDTNSTEPNDSIQPNGSGFKVISDHVISGSTAELVNNKTRLEGSGTNGCDQLGNDCVNNGCGEELLKVENGSEDSEQGLSSTLVIENLPRECTLTTLLDILGSYGEVHDCEHNGESGVANIVFSRQSACDWAQSGLDGETEFFPDSGNALKAYVKEESTEDHET